MHSIIQLNKKHEKILWDLDKACFLRPWTREHITQELLHPHSIVFGLFSQKKLLGSLFVREGEEELWIFRLMTHPQWRKTGLGHKLLGHAIQAAQRQCPAPSLWLEVSIENQEAYSLYTSMGFQMISCRRNYYPADPPSSVGSDALVMRLG